MRAAWSWAGVQDRAPGFVKVEGLQQDQDMRQVLKFLRSLKKGVVLELTISPMSFWRSPDTGLRRDRARRRPSPEEQDEGSNT